MEHGIEITKGIGVALITTLVSLLIFSAILTYTSITEDCIEPVTLIITGISILIGSFLGNLKIRKNGMLNGCLIGGIYLLILYLVSSFLNGQFGLNIQSIIMLVVGAICGVLGGVLGVNKNINKK